MKNVLIVDDEKPFLLSLTDGFSAYAGDFNLLTAENGKTAVEALKAARIDLVVTDLKMPVMDGFELLAYMSQKHPAVPVMVITAFGTPELEERLRSLGITQYLEKPLDFDMLAGKIFEELKASAEGHLQGISLAAFLQLVEMDKKTCTLEVKSGPRTGYLYILKGELVEAETDGATGEAAAYEIIGWEPVEIGIESVCKKKQKNIAASLINIILECYRLKDEKSREAQERREETGQLKEPEIKREATPPATEREEELSSNREEESFMTPQEKLKEFVNIEGFVGAGLFTPPGETLALLVTDNRVNIKDIGVLANNVLRNAQKASLDMGTGRGQLVHVEAERAHIIVRCLNEGNDPLASEPGKAHIHLVLILNSEASIGLAKLKVNSIISSLAPDFRM